MELYHIYKEDLYLGVGILIDHSENGNCSTDIIYIQNRLVKINSYTNEVYDISDTGEPSIVQESYSDNTILAEYISCPEWDEIIKNGNTNLKIKF